MSISSRPDTSASIKMSRGKYGSEGDYVMTRPPRGPLNPTDTDHSTDTWDTIDWLVKNVPESNGRVGIIGSSYEGFTAALALLDPHPALKAAVPQGPLIDAWMGDDWFHYGAFRNIMLGYVHMQTGQRGAGTIAPSDTYDKYEEFLRAGSTGDYMRSHGLDKLPWISTHDGTSRLRRVLARSGARQVARGSSIEGSDAVDSGAMGSRGHWRCQSGVAGAPGIGDEGNNWLVLGPWNHNQIKAEGSSLGPMVWSEDTARQYRRDILMPFLDEHLRDGPPAGLRALPSITRVINAGSVSPPGLRLAS